MRQPLRKRTEATGKKDVDQAARSQLLRVFFGSLVGLVLGGVAGVLGMVARDWGLLRALFVTAATWAVAFILPVALAGLGGAAARQIYSPSGRSTPSKRGYSHAESLVARGLYQEAIDAFEVAIAEDPSDPTPYLRIARVYRDQLRRFEDAARWFRRALRDATVPAGVAHLTNRELVELYVAKLGDPRRAAPLLARVAEERAGTPEGDWATEQLAQVKVWIAAEKDA